MTTAAKVAITAIGVLAVGAIAKAASGLNDIANKFLFNVFFKRIHSYKNGILTLIYGAEIKNLSGVSVTVKNAFALIQFSSDNGMNWGNIGASTSRLGAINIADNKTSAAELSVQVNVSDTLSSLLAKSNKYRIVLKYDVLGVTQQYVKAYDFTATLKKVPGFGGVEGIKEAETRNQRRQIVKQIIINITNTYPVPFTSRQTRPELPKKVISPVHKKPVPAKPLPISPAQARLMAINQQKVQRANVNRPRITSKPVAKTNEPRPIPAKLINAFMMSKRQKASLPFKPPRRFPIGPLKPLVSRNRPVRYSAVRPGQTQHARPNSPVRPRSPFKQFRGDSQENPLI